MASIEQMKSKLMELGPAGVTYKDVVNAKLMGLGLSGLASFRICLAQRERQRRLLGYGPECKITNKIVGYKFAEKIGLKIPIISTIPIPISQVEFKPGTVIKPISSHGSCGVFAILQDGTILSARDKRQVNRQEMMSSIEALLKKKKIPKDAWIVEKVIMDRVNPCHVARDIKFFAFYGEVGLIWEMYRFPDLHTGKFLVCHWTDKGEKIFPRSVPYRELEGYGINPEDIQKAREISLMIPSPFIRLDFLDGVDGFYFGEFTGGTGNFDEFNRDFDAHMGDLFVEAEGNITKDLLLGKKFDPIFNPTT